MQLGLSPVPETGRIMKCKTFRELKNVTLNINFTIMIFWVTAEPSDAKQ